jgi:hypothetical protein
MTDPVDRGRNRSETFADFARAEGFSLSTFYKLKKLGWDLMCWFNPRQQRALYRCAERGIEILSIFSLP